MKWDCGPTYSEWYEARQKWHLWFAWHPVRIGSHDCRWLEYLWRKGIPCGTSQGVMWDWLYKPAPKDAQEL